MTALWRKQIGSYVLLTAAAVVFTLSLLFSFQRIREQHEMELRDLDVSLWLVVQAEFELLRLMHALDQYALGDPAMDHDALMERFEIFWSRLPLLIEGADSKTIQGAPGAAEVPAIISELERLEPDFVTLQPQDANERAYLAARLATFAEPLHQLALEVKTAVGKTIEARRAGWNELLFEQTGYLLGILMSGGVLVMLLLRETRRTRKLLAESRSAQGKIWHLAQHDPLTDLPNRWLFNDRLEQALRRAQRHDELVAMHYVDLDNFKQVNDRFGHLVGDRFLVAAAERLRPCMRDSDTLARLGGDEFAVVQTGLRDPAGATLLAERLVAALRTPLECEGRRLSIGVSIGIGIYPVQAADAHELYQVADAALYQAKAAGRGGYCVGRVCGPLRPAPLRRVAGGA